MEQKTDISKHGPRPLERDAFRRELDSFLDRSATATTWHVESVIKQSDFETTELVWGEPRDGVAGRYIRKIIDTGSGAGAAYEELWDAQRRGVLLPCVPHMLECDRRGGSLTVVMEFVDGCTVEALVAALGSGPNIAALVVPPLCRSSHMLHTHLSTPLIHRDLKPSNVIMRDGNAVIIDFGCARAWRPDAESDTTHFLTRCYAPPEQFGFGQTDERTDVYALGKILFFCLTGEQPPNLCDVDTCLEIGMEPSLARIVGRACSFDPNGRYASADDLGHAVERALETGFQVAVPAPDEAPGHGLGVRGNAACRAVDAVKSRASFGQVLAGFKDGVSRLGSMFSARVPAWVGMLWNGAVLLFLAGMVWQSLETLAHPVAEDAGLPWAYLFFRNICYIDGVMVIVSYLLLDRRRLRTRFPALARMGVVRETAYGVAALCGLTVASAFIIALAGW